VSQAQTQIEDPPILGPLLDRVVRRLPYEAARALAEAPPTNVEADDPIGELMRLLQAKCRKRIDEPEYNEATREAIRELRSGAGTRYESIDALLSDLKS
jgi:hypothetical protein